MPKPAAPAETVRAAVADKILVLERGRLVEVGGYDPLMKREGAFYQLAKCQLL